MTRWHFLRLAAFALATLGCVPAARAGLFDDEEARRAILELRQRIENIRQSSEGASQRLVQEAQRTAEDNAQLRRSLLDLQQQIEALRGELARMRGSEEQLARDLSEVQRRQRDAAQGMEERLKRFEPAKVSLDGREFTADPAEKRDFDAALAQFKRGEFPASQAAFGDFVKRNPQSGYAPSALFWLGNAQFANRDYTGAIANFRALLQQAPDHVRAPEAVLSIANSQIELKDMRAARKTLDDLVKAYPQSEAAVAARDRLSRMR